MQKLYCGWGLSLHDVYLINRYMGSNRQGEGVAVGKYTGEIIYSKNLNLTTLLILGMSIVYM